MNDSLLTPEMLDKPEKTYPLRLMHCPDSGLAQLDYVVDGIEIYYPDYPYRSGISWPLEHSWSSPRMTSPNGAIWADTLVMVMTCAGP